ncbi:SCO-spondin-like [Glandiceps talaboti]
MIRQLLVIAAVFCIASANRNERSLYPTAEQCASMPDQFRYDCPSGTSPVCIYQHYFCDSLLDCQGGTDEASCGAEKHQANCKSDYIDKSLPYFQCTSDKMCVDACRRCDGVCDCIDKSDEQNCASTSAGCSDKATVDMCA